jgi:hypothetical protein
MQEVENLRFYSNALSSPPQFLSIDIKRVIVEMINQPFDLRCEIIQLEENIGESGSAAGDAVGGAVY